MIDGLKPYPKYQSVSIFGLESIPAHWSAPRLKTLFREVDRRSGTGVEPLLSLRMKQGLVDHHQMGGKLIPASNLTHYKVARPGDLVMNRMRAAAGLFGVPTKLGLVSPDYAVLCPKKPLQLQYFLSLFKTPAMMSLFRLESRGLGTGESGFLRLYTERFGMLSAPVPPPDEQAAIVRFLDHADRRIRRLISVKQKLIKLLEEQKQVIVQQAVTQGLDSSVPMKDSGMDWLGAVPGHWNVLALRRHWSVIDCKHVTVPFVDEGIPLASVREAQAFDLGLQSANRTTRQWYEKLIEGGRRPRIGDLIYCRNVSVGAAAYVDTEAEFAMGQDVCIIRSDDMNQRWLNYYLRSPAMTRQLSMILVGSTFNRINIADIKGLIVPVPPRSQQDAIVDYLDAALRGFEVGRIAATRTISLLRELRTRLIADVVTGQLDVRAAAAALPDEPTDDEPFDDADEASDDDGDETSDTAEGDEA